MFLNNVYKGRTEFWRYLVTIILVIVAFGLLGSVPLVGAVAYALLQQGSDGSEAEIFDIIQRMDWDSVGMDLNYVLFLIILQFVIGLIALWGCLIALHKRSIKTLITPSSNVNWSKILFAFGLYFVMLLIVEGIFYLMEPDNYIYQFDMAKFLPLLAIALLVLPIQTSFEELFFRGYLMQGIGSIAVFRIIPLVITSVLFGLMHGANPEVSQFGYWTMMSYYIGTGFFLGILTLMDDSLELALGIHAANNIYGALMATFDASALQTAAIFKMKEVNVDFQLPVLFAMAGIFIFVAAKKYGWSDWSKIYGRITKKPLGGENIDDLIA